MGRKKGRYGYGGARRLAAANGIVPDDVLLARLQSRTNTVEQPKNYYNLQLPCKVWTGATAPSRNGDCRGQIYTSLCNDGSPNLEYVHRVAYRILVGPLEDSELVLHKCNIPLCIEGTHLYKGTSKDNYEDAVREGTHINVKGKMMPKTVPFEVAIRAEPPDAPTNYFFDLWVGEDDLILQDVEITKSQYDRLKELGIVEV